MIIRYHSSWPEKGVGLPYFEKERGSSGLQQLSRDNAAQRIRQGTRPSAAIACLHLFAEVSETWQSGIISDKSTIDHIQELRVLIERWRKFRQKMFEESVWFSTSQGTLRFLRPYGIINLLTGLYSGTESGDGHSGSLLLFGHKTLIWGCRYRRSLVLVWD